MIACSPTASSLQKTSFWWPNRAINLKNELSLVGTDIKNDNSLCNLQYRGKLSKKIMHIINRAKHFVFLSTIRYERSRTPQQVLLQIPLADDSRRHLRYRIQLFRRTARPGHPHRLRLGEGKHQHVPPL